MLFVGEKIKTEGFQLLSILDECGLTRSTIGTMHNMGAVTNGDLSGESKMGTFRGPTVQWSPRVWVDERRGSTYGQ